MIEERDYIRAQYLNLKPRPVILALGLLVLALVTLTSGVALLEVLSGQLTSSNLMMIGAAIFFAGYFGYSHWKFKRTYRQYKALHVPLTIEFAEDGLRGSSTIADGVTPWEHFLKTKEGKHLFLIYPCDNLFHIVPKRLFPDAESLQETRSLLARRIRR
jgi:hypothetical protein